MARYFSLVFILIALALAGGAYAADPSSPSPPTTSNTIGKSPPAPPAGKNSTDSQDYSDYEVPEDLAPGGVEVVEDYVPISPNASKEADELAQPEGQSNKKTNQHKNSASSYSFSSFSIVLIFAVGLSLF